MDDKRPSWDAIWMTLATNVSMRSYDPKLKVGAVCVTRDNESVLSIGYNGDEKGGENKRDSLEPGGSNLIHAEVNAIAKMNYTDPREKKIYLTHSPCPVCARLLINAGIKEVFYKTEFRDKKGLQILEKRDIMVKKLSYWE